MPVKNTSPFLRACLDSIVQQTWVAWELLAVDDHSSDDSLQILKAYAAQDKRIRVISNEGNGVTAALQTGHKQALGQYITRMDSDDINEPNKYAHMLGQLQQIGESYVALGEVKYFCDQRLGEGFQN